MPERRIMKTAHLVVLAGLAVSLRRFAREIGLEPRTTPIESPQSDGMAEAFVRTIKRDYV
jgi:putative transposase